MKSIILLFLLCHSLSAYNLESWGISSNSGRSAALITPLHFVSATHYHPSVGELIVFTDNETGATHSGVIEAYTKITGTDIIIGKFTSDINSSIGPADVSAVDYLSSNTPLLSCHRNGVTWEGFVLDYTVHYSSGYTVLRYFCAPLASGDSGYPCYVISDGDLLLTGTHYARAEIGMGLAYDSPLGLYYSEIAAVVRADGYEIGIGFPDSKLFIGIENNQITLTWETYVGFNYYIEESPDLQNWVTIVGPIAGDDTIMQYAPVLSGMQFWRLRVDSLVSDQSLYVSAEYGSPEPSEDPLQKQKRGWGKGGKPKLTTP